MSRTREGLHRNGDGALSRRRFREGLDKMGFELRDRDVTKLMRPLQAAKSEAREARPVEAGRAFVPGCRREG